MSTTATPFRWAVLGPGSIARRFATQLPDSQDGVLVAVGSSSPERARAFADEFPLAEPALLGDYAEVLASDEVDAVYISTVHTGHAALAARHAGQPAVSTFYQIWDRPLMTINDTHLIADVIRLCGGRNVFGDLSQLAPTIGVEAVLAAWESPAGDGLRAAVRTALATDGDGAGDLVRSLVLPGLHQLVGGPPEEAERRTALVATQLGGLVVLRHVLQLPALVAMSVQQLALDVGPGIQRYLTGPLA